MKAKFGVLVSFFASLCVVCAYLILLLVLGSLTGCTAMAQTVSESSFVPTAETDPVFSGDAAGFQPVLQGRAPFFSTDAGQSLSIHELGRAAGIDGNISVEPIKFAVIDLDGDNVQEMVLWLEVNENDFYGFEILRQQDGQIYGYTLAYRAFMDLKKDGTFSFSSGAADSGFGSISFTDKSYRIDEIARSESSYDADNELTISYFVNGQAAAEAEFLSAAEKQDRKEDVLWHEFKESV